MPGRGLSGASRRRLVPGLALALAVFLLLFLKNPGMLLEPALYAEDGTQMLAHYYCPRGPGSIVRFYNGYVSLLPNAIGYLSLRAPISLAPTLLAAVPFALTGLCFLLPLVLRLYEPGAGSDSASVAVLLLAALPLGNAALVANTTYSFWNGLLALALLALAPAAVRWPGLLTRFLASALLLVSHPLSVVVLPIFLVSLMREVRQRQPRAVLTGLLVVVGVAYQLSWVGHEGVELRPLGRILQLALRYLGERVAFAAVFGNEARLWLHANGLGWLVTLLGGVLIVGVGLLCWRRLSAEPRARGLVLGLGYLVLAITFAAVIGRNVRSGLLWDRFGEHYFYVQKALFWLLLVFCIRPLLTGVAARARRAGLVLLCAYVLVLGWVERGSYDISGEEADRVAAFVRNVAALERARGGRRGIDVVLERADGRQVRLRAPAENVPCDE